MKDLIKQMPVLGSLVRVVHSHKNHRTEAFTNSENYWIERYKSGGNSGLGSYGELAKFKAEVLNRFVTENNVSSVIEYGCGDGNQLKLAVYPQYIGFDISPDCIAHCKATFANDSSKSFKVVSQFDVEQADLCLSLDVIYHLVEEAVYEQYMTRLFRSARRFVVIYSTNFESPTDVPHVRHRRITDWVSVKASEWRLRQHVPNRFPTDKGFVEGAQADFFIFEQA